MISTITSYFTESIQELELVRWPTRQQAVRLSTVVLIFTLICSAVFGLIDLGLSELVHFLLSLTF